MATTTTTLATKIPDVTTDIMGTRLTISFRNGEFLEVNTEDLSHEIRLQSMLHGLKQKLVDAAAIGRNTDTGRSATIDDKFEAVREVYDRIIAGQWNKARGDGSGKGSKSYLCEALMELFGKTREQVTAFMAGKTKEELAALKTNERVAAVITRLERAKVADVDTDSMFDEIGEL